MRMTDSDQNYRKATSLAEVDNAVRFDVPVAYEHPFFTDFSDVRGDFEDRMIYKTLNVHPQTFVFNREVNRGNKVMLFLAGMRGSGKTSELAKITSKLHNPEGFFCVTCNLDQGLDLNDMEYMDILIFQLERLFEEMADNLVHFDPSILTSLQNWFSERISEMNRVIKREGGIEMEVEAKTPSLLSFLGITAKLKGSMSASKETANIVRTVLRTNFTDFARKFNEFVETVNLAIRERKMGQELLFVVDGLEKTATVDIRKKIVLEESNRIRLIKANTVFTLPIELMVEKQRLIPFSTVVSFPFVKIREKDGTIVEEAVKRFEIFIEKRIDSRLFDSRDTIREAILFGGGSPRDLLRILEYANLYADEDSGKITIEDLRKAIAKLAAETSQYLSEEDLEILKRIKVANEENKPIPYDPAFQDLLEKLIVFEYNDGTYKRVNPIVEASPLYKQYVG